MLENLELLKNKKCLLAFSHGTDSTALFYLLNDEKIDFDIAFVNYKTRQNSDIEQESAKRLAGKFNKKFHLKIAPLNTKSNFEKRARDIRYSFFDEICIKFSYEILIFAHQLNDCFEWFLMQLSKGSGVATALGLEPVSKKNISFQNEKKEILIVRPLINCTKSTILNYLESRNLQYFNDISNQDLRFKRNFIRAKFSDEFIKKFGSGVIKSFAFLRNDRLCLLGEFVYESEEFFVVNKGLNSIHLIDIAVKKLGVLMSEKTRLEVLRGDCVVSHKVVIASNEKYYFISPFKKCVMDKKFKEKCRILKVPPLLRGYLAKADFSEVCRFFKDKN